jgi:hypothetical protein
MGIEQKTIVAAQSYSAYDEDALLVILGKQEAVIDEDYSLAADPTLDPEYDSTHMGVIDDLKGIGSRIAQRWNKELYKLVCGSGDSDNRKQLLDALNVSEAAAIGVVASLLLAITPAAVAAPLAALLVKTFLIPAKDELCEAWAEAVKA